MADFLQDIVHLIKFVNGGHSCIKRIMSHLPSMPRRAWQRTEDDDLRSGHLCPLLWQRQSEPEPTVRLISHALPPHLQFWRQDQLTISFGLGQAGDLGHLSSQHSASLAEAGSPPQSRTPQEFDLGAPAKSWLSKFSGAIQLIIKAMYASLQACKL